MVTGASYHSALKDLTRDGSLLFLTRFTRLFAYGALSVVLVLYLTSLGLTEPQTGLLLTLTLVGDTFVSLFLTTRADRIGRRRMLIIGALLMAGAGLAFASTTSLVLLTIAGTIGVISPSGNEVGPFLSIEQAALSHVVPSRSRTTVFAWYSERFIHSEIYRARLDVIAIVHTHAPDLIPFTTTAIPLRPIYHMAGFLSAGVPVFEIRKAGGMTDILIRNGALGKALAQTLGDKSAVLLRGHGAVVVAPTLHLVAGWSYYMSLNARIQWQALLAQTPVTYLDPEEAKKATIQDGYERFWEAGKKKLEAK